MTWIMAVCVAIQCGVLVMLVLRLGRQSLGRLGFLLMATAFCYHGLTEIVQAVFPGRNSYRIFTDTRSMDLWLIVITSVMVLFTAVYLWHINVRAGAINRLGLLRAALSRTFLVRWPILLGMGAVGLVLTIVEPSAESGTGYWAGGLADQFTVLLLALSLSTLCLTTSGRRTLFLFACYSILIVGYGARNRVLVMMAMAVSAIARYGQRIPIKTLLGLGLIVALCFTAISISRKEYGRFVHGESFGQRLAIIGASAGNPEEHADAILDDTVYRFDGNSYGALVLERQFEGYGTTGLAEVLNTIGYVTPAFINSSKMTSDGTQRNEKGYQCNFYDLGFDVDYVSDLWNLMVGYIGWAGMLLLAPAFGYGMAALDNWLASSITIESYLSGITLSYIPVSLELGVAGIPYTLRGLAFLLLANKVIATWHLKHSARKKVTPDTMAAYR